MKVLLQSLPRLPVIVIGIAALLLAANDALPGRFPVDADAAALLLSIVIGATGLVAAAGQWVDRGRVIRAAPRVAQGLLVSLVATAVAIATAELATRWIYRNITTTSDDRGYFSRRWLRSGAVSYNQHGFREREFTEVKAPGVVRIAVLGDSFAFGNGIAAEQRFSALLQHALPSNIEVLNFGVPGNNSREHVTTLRRILRFGPDFVLLQWFVNDTEGTERDRPGSSSLVPASLHERLHESSALYTFFDTWRARRQSRALSSGSYAEYLLSRYGDPQADAVRVDREAMRALASGVREAGSQLGVVLFPDAGYDLGAGYPFGFLHERMLAFCAEQHLSCLDLRLEFAAVRQRQSLWANPLDTHPSAAANLIASTRILQVFQPLWLAAAFDAPER